MQSSNPVLQYFLGAGVAVFPSIGFLYQYRLINSRKSVGTFSIYVCGVMFLCNFLRIGFFIYKQFSIALLLQSVLNILMQILLLNLCIKTMNAEGYFQQNHNQNDSQDRSCLKNFWKWKQINKYFVIVLFGALLILILGVLIRKYDLENAGQCLGYAAMTAETFLLIPQIIQNLRQQKVKGISYIFVGLNTLQDALELAYVLLYSQPLQFLIFNSLQLLTNILLIIQIAIYKNCYKNTDQKEQEKGMVQFHENSQETKHDQILSGHEIICINPSDVNHSSKSEQFPLKRLEGSVQKYQKKSLPNIVQ